jgi:large subunit ribosomal protein L22
MEKTNSAVIAKAKLMKIRISPKKMGPVVDLIKGKSLTSAKMLLKVLESAEANAVNNHKMPKDNVCIEQIWVGQGPVTKSGQFVGRGNFHPILKRTSNIYVNLIERASK